MRRILAVAALFAVTSVVAPSAQAPQAPAPSTKGVVIKGKAPVSNEVLKVKLPRPAEVKLANGAHLMVLEDHRLPQVFLTIVIPGAGGYFDPAGLPGVAQVTSAMMREGTKTRTTLQISEQLETLAANVSVNTGMSSESASVGGSALTENFDKVLEIAADVLLNPTFPPEELARYKTRTKSGLIQQRTNPGFLANEMFSRAVFGSHPAASISITADGLEKITPEMLKAFHAERYAPDHAVIGIAGDITLAEAKAKIEKYLSGWAKKGSPRPAVTDPAPLSAPRVLLVDRVPSVQTFFAVGTQSIPRTSADYDLLQVTNNIIGGGPTGRLFLNLREEKGLTYGAYSNLMTPRYCGYWMASTSVQNGVSEIALTEIMKEIARLRDEAVPDKEFEDKKRSMVASFALSLESASGILSNYMTSYQYGLPADYWDRYPERIAAITKAKVQEAARKYLDPSRIQIVAVGDGKTLSDVLKKFGKVEVFNAEGKPVAQ